ncbi:RluA family pseudouridine synthase [Balneolaceae bacterium ANBcel3]|nr:RluA family pseudouridine synthase [Balneolaceae bacterium ANBcel3]
MQYDKKNKNPEIPILYEDNHLLVVNKPPGVLSQSDHTGDADMLSILKHDLKVRYSKPGNVFLGLVHRLDRMTRGVMVFAKTSKAASRLSLQIRERTFQKRYTTVVYSPKIIPVEGVYSHYLTKDSASKKAHIHNQAIPDSKKAVLEISHVAANHPWYLLDIDLHTGRFHQIRAQLAALGFPVFGDKKYGSTIKNGGDFALLCRELRFKHPVRKEPLSFRIPLPKNHPWLLFFSGKHEDESIKNQGHSL